MSIASVINSILLGSQAINNLTQVLTNATTLSMPNIVSLNFTAATATFGYVETTLGWQSYTPVATPQTGSITSSVISGEYYALAPVGGIFMINLKVQIVTTGSATPPVNLTLPAGVTAVNQCGLNFSDGNGDAGWAFCNTGTHVRFAPVTPNSGLTDNTQYNITGFIRT